MNQEQILRPPHGLKPRVEVPIDWYQVALVAGTLLVAVLLIWWGWRYWRRQSKKQVASTSEPSGPGRVALLVSELRAMELPSSPEAFDQRTREEFYWRLGVAFRTAVEWRTGIGATAQTLNELRDPLRLKLPLPRRETDEALQLLEDSEFIKFAGTVVSTEAAEAARQKTIRLIGKLFPGEAVNP